jgi:beta-lactamase class A
MPTDALSVTLVDLNSKEEAFYQQEKLRFPASVVKLFWLVNLQEQLRQGLSLEDDKLIEDLPKMIHQSDNEAASRIVARITQTESGSNLIQQEFNLWLNQRKQVNRFFEAAGYQGINLSQKTFPIPYLHLHEPQGRELQMRGSLEKPIRNKITTQQAARLMYEIVTAQAVSKQDSQKMLELLTINTVTRVRKREIKDSNTFNPVRGYFSQSLPDDVYFAGKAGWTSRSRQETAYIATPDGKTKYILTIFAEDRSYAYDWKIFPKMSVLVFEHMNKRT